MVHSKHSIVHYIITSTIEFYTRTTRRIIKENK